MQIPRWRNVLILKNSLVPALSQSITTKTHFASIHSTPITCDKRKSKRDGDERGSQQPSKAYIRYSISQKPSAAKRALQGLLYNSGVSRSSFQHIEPIQSFDAEPSVGSRKKKLKAYAQRAKKYHQDRMRSKLRRESFSDDFGDPETISRATFKNKQYVRSNKSFGSEPSGFEWREPPKWKNQRYRGWDATSETEYDNTSYSVGSHSDRTILGLPPTGPLKIEDVKNAFRLSALKWHPDKHQDASLAVAEEKFKLCVDAYKSLCEALA
uniref:J domain-containing protein n=1 Tax=Populus davidiana TaxID=266767 RepID=A0A6M2E7B3_9ROSI